MLCIGHFDADGVFAWDRRDDAHARHLQMQREIVAERRDLVDAHAGFESDFVLRDDGAGVDADDLDVEIEVLERLFQDDRLVAQFLIVLLVGERLRVVQERQRRQLVVLEGRPPERRSSFRCV